MVSFQAVVDTQALVEDRLVNSAIILIGVVWCPCPPLMGERATDSADLA